MQGNFYDTGSDNGFRVFQGLINGIGLSILFWAALIALIVLVSR